MLTDRTAEHTESIASAAAAMAALHQAGWLISEMGKVDADGRLLLVVCGSNGGNLIRVEGSSPAEAWGRALDQARSLGMLGQSELSGL